MLQSSGHQRKLEDIERLVSGTLLPRFATVFDTFRCVGVGDAHDVSRMDDVTGTNKRSHYVNPGELERRTGEDRRPRLLL